VLTRNRPSYLAECLRGLRAGMHTTSCESRLMIWNNGESRIPEQTHGVGYNVGQHVSMNRLIQEASDIGADWFLRVDDDCVFQTPHWLRKMVHIVTRHVTTYKRPCVLSPTVHGLRNPPPSLGDVWLGRYHLQIVPILGGICRLMPMSHLRYWRFDERMPMGWSEASNYVKYCMLTSMPILRTTNIEVSHGESTDAQEAADPDYAYESEMLKMTPWGL
jgi:hypothetical protein